MIGYYVHHHGRGHATRALTIARALGDDIAVTGLGSGPPPDGWPGPWVRLARDDDPAPAAGDPTARGALHWAPPGHRGLRERSAQLLAWIVAATPHLLVVDVSVEVAVLARTAGVPVVVMGMPGLRTDAPHALAYQLADAVLAPWPAWAGPLETGPVAAPPTIAVGAISRFDGRARLPRESGDEREVVVLSGAGGTAVTAAEIDAARRATPAWRWTVLGPPGDRWEADPWPLLCGADVVVTHAGQNAIADVAAARAPAIVLPQERPFAEQSHLARVLDAAGLAAVEHCWPAPGRWPGLLEQALARGGAGWSVWAPGDGAALAAAALHDIVAATSTSTEPTCAPR